ncbi:hypothetical protein LOTGIDRAFT_159278 [Lottia gigantea]|uniref:EH domain-containing protein n=1 Tax=Lottia gigantea TaxID=225164 RepID=V4AR01_LOTGI|nr:hypothetical protein LOTGIDRAFT_159278 [Lottia gigantea]ESO97255.1 hypothetical protein LOTGIDRAFT_159278 [Lottia gigantea]
MACSDLNAPKTAKLFHKPAVKDVQVSHHTNKTYHQSDQARQWQSSTELEGLFHQNIPEAQPGPVPPAEAAGNTSSVVASASTTASPAAGTPSGKLLPEWCYRSGKDLPPLYQQVYEAALVDGKIDTNRLYPILLLSCLPREVLGYIWSMCNTATPGQLIQTELNAVLALIALAQNNHSIMNKEILKRCPQPPLPILQSVPPVAPGGVAPSVSPGPQPTPGTPQPNQLPENQNQPSVAPTNQAPATSSFSVVAPKPTLGTGIVQQNPGTIQPISAPTASLTPHSIGGTMGGSRNINQSEPAIITHTSEDDFADFQSADKATTEDEFGEFMGTNNPACITVEEKPPYIISVPKVDPKVSDEMTADEKYSNVRSFFGSSGSSGHTSPNSLDEEDYTDCRDSTSQFSTSEQSENEDIKAFESYVEEFNRKKEKLHPESPLHNPFPRLPVIDKATSNIVIPPIPSSFGLQLSSEATPQDDFDDFKSAIQVSTPSAVTTVTSSDSEFADFQTSSKPVPSSSSTSNDLNLIGDEDKYGALRSLVLEDPATTTKPSEATVPFAQFDEAVTENESDDWADFASAAPEESANNGNNKSSVLNVNSTKQPETDWADFGDTVTPTAETVNIQPSWISSNPTLLTPTNIMSRSSNSVSSTSLAGTETEDDWSDFSTAINQDSQATPSNPLEESDWFNSTGTSDTTTSVVTVKKALKSDEIQNVFKVRNDPNTQASYKIPTLEKKVRQISLDDDDPPPMDYHDEGDDHDITRGYDLEEYHNPSPLSGYGYSNQNKGMFLNQVAKKISEKSDRDRTSLSPETEDDSYSSKDSYNWKGKTKHFKEDSQSISSLELPTKTASLKTGSDNGGSDSQSISSMEFGQFESSSKTPVSAESKSLDSLDFPQDLPGDGDPDETLENTDTVDLDSSMNQSTPGISNGIKPLADRYNITDEVVTSDGYSYEWERCLQNCLRMIKESNIIFNSISTSNVCTEVLQSSKGSAYIDGIVEIYRVACRVMTAMNAHNLATPQLEKLMKEIDLAWTNLTAFLVGAGVLPESKSFDFKHGIMKSDSEEDQYKSCGVCLLNVDTRLKVISGVEDISKLSYGRKQYHAPCANFWVNCVDSTLPGLRLPELL